MKLMRKIPFIPILVLAHRVVITLAMAVILFAAGFAFAQDADGGLVNEGTVINLGTTDVVIDGTVVPPAVKEEILVQGAMKVFGDTSKEIRNAAADPKSPKILLIIIALMGVAQLVKRVGRKLPTVRGFSLGLWLNNHWWADWVMSIVLSIGGAMVTSVSAGGSIDLGLIVNAVVIGMMGAGFGPGAPKPDATKAQEAGAAAAADPSKTLNG